jgi:SAM-dependent methyltransferase
MNVYSSAYFDKLNPRVRSSAERIVPHLLHYVPAKSVIDVGCGIGTWLSVFQSCGVQDILGVDGSYVDLAQLQIPQGCFLTHDLETPFSLDRGFDLALSLEVAEHLCPEAANTFVESLTSLSPVVVFSAAVPGQGGDRHINEQWPPYWIERFQQRGYEAIDVLRRPFWDDDEVEWWYAQNLFFFVDDRGLDSHPQLRDAQHEAMMPVSLAHPKNLAQSAWREKTLEFCLRLTAALPKSTSTTLIDDGQLGGIHLGIERQWLPFIERDGQYFGRPSDDEHAISELTRMRENGCQFVAIAWTAFWWLDHYRGFADFLNNVTASVVEDDMLRLFRFRG